jgi:hypothetical protein
MQKERRNDLGTETVVAGEDRATRRGPIADLSRALPLVQRHADGRIVEADPAAMRRTAATGLSGSGGPLPYLAQLQASFGPAHDLGQVRAHVGGAAATASHRMGATAYAAGDQVAFSAPPDLRLAAHEAAHVVQQRDGVQLKSGVGEVGDAHEQAADAVAERVVRGESASDLLPRGGRTGTSGDLAVQRYLVGDVAGNRGGRISESGETAVDLAGNALYATTAKIDEANALLKTVGERGSYISLAKGRIRYHNGRHEVFQVIPEIRPLSDDPSNQALRDANQPHGRDSDDLTGQHYAGYKAATWADCGRTAAAIMGADSDQNHGAASAHFRAGEEAYSAGPSNAPRWMSDQIYMTVMPKFLADAKHAAFLKAGVHYEGDVSSLRMPSHANEARAQYVALDKEGQRAFDLYAAINTAASPDVGGAYVMNTEFGMPGFRYRSPESPAWCYHWAGVIMKDGVNDIALENYAVAQGDHMTEDDQYNWIDRRWRFQMYGTATEGQSFHEQHLATGTHGTRASSFATKVDQ